jgi:hypothetical protein
VKHINADVLNREKRDCKQRADRETILLAAKVELGCAQATFSPLGSGRWVCKGDIAAVRFAAPANIFPRPSFEPKK